MPSLAHSRPIATIFRSACLLLALLVIGAPQIWAAEPVTVTDYTDPGEALTFGQRSNWKQPWRSYLDTMPGSALRTAVGLNFNVQPKQAASTARLLAEDGFHRARIEIGWNSLDYEDPTRLSAAGQKNLETYLGALRDHDIRPLILLNANDGQPCPVQAVTLHLTSPVAAGDTVIHLSPDDVSQVAPGRTGFRYKGKAALVLIKAIDASGTAHLSRPAGTAYPAGAVQAETLRYPPFNPPFFADGTPNPQYQVTMAGWLNYVDVVTTEAERVLGSEAFDVEIWNELGFGSAFLNVNNYYDPDLPVAAGGVTNQIRDRTIIYLRNPAHGVPNIGIGNGFANQRPWANGTESPLGLSAIDKHPYSGWAAFPAAGDLDGNRPLDGLGQPTGWQDAEKKWHEIFSPTYDAFFPERFLSAINTETLVNDLSPTPSPIIRVMHGRYTHPEGGSPPRMWITEVNLGPTSGPVPASQMSAEDIRHVETKNVLRYITAYVNKGVEAIHLYAASAGSMSLVDKPFLQATTANPTVYPGTELGGETMTAVRRLTDAMKGSRITEPRSLDLQSLTDFNSNIQFAGDPNDPVHYPPLYNRDVFAFLPFQTSNTRFVIPMYVMTRNVVEIYNSGTPTDPARFDLPEEHYRLQIGGIHGIGAVVSAIDPITGETTPADVISSGNDEIVVDVEVTDSPRLLTIQELGLDSTEPELSDQIPAGVGEVPFGDDEPEEPGAPGEEEGPEDENGTPGHGDEGEPGPEEPGRQEKVADNTGADSPHRPAGTSSRETSVADSDATVSVALLGSQALLRRHRMHVKGRCTPDCRLHVVGRLSIGPGQTYRMFQPPHQLKDGTSSPSVTLGISSRAAKIARRAMREGIVLHISLTGRAEFSGTTSRKIAKSVALKRRSTAPRHR